MRETKIFSVDTALQWIRFEEDGKERFITLKKLAQRLYRVCA